MHLLVIFFGLAANEFVAAISCSSLVLFATTWAVLAHRMVFSFAFVLVHILGNTLLYGYMNFLYLRFTSLPSGEYHDVSAWLGALSVISTAVGAGVMHMVLGPDGAPREPTPVIGRWETLLVVSLVFGALVLGQLATGFLNSRWEAPTEGGFGARYIVTGIGPIWTVFFFVLGARLKGSLASTNNLVVVGFVAVVALVQGLSGGRGMSLWIIALLLIGAAWARFERRSLAVLATGFLAIGVVFSMAVQEARGQRGFAFGSAGDRADLLRSTTSNVAQGLVDSESSGGGNALEPLIGRMFEFSGQDIIDHTVRTQRFAGFENFDRLQYLFVPMYLAPNKMPLSDGVEILTRELGYNLGFTGVPITLIGDSFRRGGALWVGVIAFIVGAVLRLLPRVAIRTVGRDFAIPFVAVHGTFLLSLHGESVLGAISAMSYHFVKQLFIFWLVTVGIRATISLFAPRVIHRGGLPSRLN